MTLEDIENKIKHLENQLLRTNEKLKYWRSQAEYFKDFEIEQKRFDQENQKFIDEIINQINKTATEYYGTPIDIREKTRLREFVYPRHYYCYFMNTFFKSSLSYIGKAINRNHATVINSIRSHSDLIKTADVEYHNLVTKLNQELQ